MAKTKIHWTDATWNPVTGCTPISSGCANCYAQKMAHRLKRMGQEKYRNGFEVTCHPDWLDWPLKDTRPKRIFVNSMSDLFHLDVPEAFIQDVFKMMGEAHWHTFQVLTKRADRLEEISSRLPWHPNIWMGVTIEDDPYTWRADALRSTGAAVKFVSLEPLLGPLPSLDLAGLDWVIVGGESGPKARPMQLPWVLPIRDASVAAGMPFFFKQWGGRRKPVDGDLLQGQRWHQFPIAVSRYTVELD